MLGSNKKLDCEMSTFHCFLAGKISRLMLDPPFWTQLKISHYYFVHQGDYYCQDTINTNSELLCINTGKRSVAPSMWIKNADYQGNLLKSIQCSFRQSTNPRK